MTSRELRGFERVAEAVVGPVAPLPHVRDTDAAAAFERSLRAAPRPNALVLRALFLIAVVCVRAHIRLPDLLDKLVRSLTYLHYYGDDGVMRLIGYDPDAVLARAAEARAR